jgi:uncharacterized protein DUF4357/RelA/SpoT family protein
MIALPGSDARSDEAPSLASNVRAYREQLRRSGKLRPVENSNILRFVQDVAFTSPSAAAPAVMGTSRNGRVDWISETTMQNTSIRSLRSRDQIGALIITFFKSDVERIDGIITNYFKPIEIRDRVPDSEWEFGYFGKHYVLIIPGDVKSGSIATKDVPEFFELQIKTLFQHAWSEAEHDLGYKPGSVSLGPEEKRKLAYTSAQAWGADQIFDGLFRSLGSATTH